MLLVENRLKKIRDFKLLFKHGHWLNGNFFDLKYLKLAEILDYFPKKEDVNTFKKQLKIAVVVGLKISKKATKRNLLKRQMREVVRPMIKDGLITDGYYFMLVAKKGSLDLTYAQISQEIQLLLNKFKK